MKIVKRDADNVVLYVGNDLMQDEGGVYGDGWRHPGLTGVTLVEATEPPATYLGSSYTYTGAWAAIPARQEDIDAHQADIAIRNKPVVPASVTMRQARLVLLNAGFLDAVTDAINSMAGDEGAAARIEWEFSSEVRRYQPLVLAIAPVLGITSEQLDQLFIEAATL